MKKLLKTYCDRKFLNYKSVRFLINGERFDPDKNPTDVCSNYFLAFSDIEMVSLFLMELNYICI